MTPAGRLKRYCSLQKEAPVRKLGLSAKMMSRKVFPFFHEERGFRNVIANEKFGDSIIGLLSECFSNEPMGAALGLSAHDLTSLIARFIPECTNNSLSVASHLDGRQNGDIQC